MRDPFGSFQGMLGQFQRFIQNPIQYMLQKNLNIPPEYTNDTNGVIQYLMNTGKLTQEQYNWVKQQADQIEHNPQFMQFLNGMNKRQ